MDFGLIVINGILAPSFKEQLNLIGGFMHNTVKGVFLQWGNKKIKKQISPNTKTCFNVACHSVSAR